MAQIKLLKKTDNKIFWRREWISLVIIFLLIVVGNKMSAPLVLNIATIFISFCILRSDVSNSFYWAIFLIPNIRMLDGTGVKFLVNAMMALPVIVYFLKIGVKKIPTIAVLGSITLFIIELTHDAVLCDFGNIITIVGWSLNIFLCILVTVDSRVSISKNDIFSALSTGILMSAIMYLVSGLTSIPQVFENINAGARFTAFADDPNYYSVYICLAIACILNVTDKNIYKFFIIVLLVGIGLLTASKMCILLMVFEFVLICIQLFNSKRDNKKFIIELFLGLGTILIVFRDYISVFIKNFIRRLGNTGEFSLNFDQLTTGRITIISDYLSILLNNITCLLFGYGFNYHLFLEQSSQMMAHNTYLDLLLAWGIVGTIIFIFILHYWVRTYKKSREIRKIDFVNLIPMIVLIINFLDLSCLSASMFPFVLAIVLIQCVPSNT